MAGTVPMRFTVDLVDEARRLAAGEDEGLLILGALAGRPTVADGVPGQPHVVERERAALEGLRCDLADCAEHPGIRAEVQVAFEEQQQLVARLEAAVAAAYRAQKRDPVGWADFEQRVGAEVTSNPANRAVVSTLNRSAFAHQP